MTLAAEGYPINPDAYMSLKGGYTQYAGLAFRYDPIAELKLVGVEESADHFRVALRRAMLGDDEILRRPTACKLDLRWRDGKVPPMPTNIYAPKPPERSD